MARRARGAARPLNCLWSAAPQVNVAAVNRFISAAVPDRSAAQKAALRAVGHKQGPASSGGEREEQEAAAEAAAFLDDTLAELQGGEQQAQQGGGKQAKRKA